MSKPNDTWIMKDAWVDPDDIKRMNLMAKNKRDAEIYNTVPHICPGGCGRDLRLMTPFEREAGICANCGNDHLEYMKLKKRFG